MSTTHSGRLLLPQNFGIPSLHDVAIQSGRIVRFSGACRVHWTVLHHLLVCRTLVDVLLTHMGPCGECHQPPGDGCTCYERAPLAVLLHDGEEVATSDIPSLWKTDDMRRLTEPLTKRIYQTYFGRLLNGPERALLKSVDRLALAAEAQVVGPPGVFAHSGMEQWVHAYEPTGQLLDAAVHAVYGALKMAPTWADTMDGLSSSLVVWYLGELESCGVANAFGEQLRLIAAPRRNRDPLGEALNSGDGSYRP